MKRNSTVLMVLILICGLVVAGCAGAQPTTAKAAATQSTATVQRGTLTATVNSAGNIAAHQVVTVNFGQSGTVQKIAVQVGDRVKAGQVLAEIDTSDLTLQVQNAQVNLDVAKVKLAQTKAPTTPQDIANARSQLEVVQASYAKLAAGPTKPDLAAAQAALASAQASYDAAVKASGGTASAIESASVQMEKAIVTLQQAQGAYDKVATAPNIAARSEAVTLQNATIDYNQAKANYDNAVATSGSNAKTQVAQAVSSLQGAQASLAKLQASDYDLVASKAAVTQAQNNLDKLLAGPDANTLAIAQSQVDQAAIALQQAEIKLKQAQMVAPFNGIVTTASLTLGQVAATSGTTAAIQVADLDHLEIVVNMAEVDVPKIKVGQTAQISLDALANVSLTGEVTLVAPAGVLSQGVVNYPVTVAIKDATAEVKTGMTANVNIITDQRDNVLVVPNRAVSTVGRQKMVTVVFEGRDMTTPVVTGMSGDTTTEIVSGLKEGDVVVVGATAAAQSNRAPGVGGGGLFVGGPRGD